MSTQSDSDSSDDDPLFNGGEDEEIDEELAFTKEDQARYGAWFDEEVSDGDEDAGSDAEDVENAEEEAGGEGDVNLDSSSEDGGAAREDAWLEGPVWGSDDDETGSQNGSEELGEGREGAVAPGEAHEAMLDSILQRGRTSKSGRPAVISEAVAEDEFNVGAGGEGASAPLTVQELVAATVLSAAERKSLAKVAKGKEALEAALPKRIRERHDRKAAYDVSKKKISEWTPLVRANREAATLHLKRDAAVPRVATAAGLASRHEAVSAFEQEVAELLKQAGHTSTKAIAEAEEQLAAQAMTSEEVKKRQDAMARNSALLFYHEQKAKRLKKIKSKAYHRHLKKQTAKAKAALGTNDLDDPDTLAERAEEEEFERAKERLTLKHRNTSRWARRTLKRGVHLATDEQQDALHEQLRLGRELRSKPAAAATSSDSDASSAGSSGEDDNAENSAQPRLTNREKLALAEAVRSGSAGDFADSLPKKGLFAMPFMRRALKQQAQQVAADAEDMLRADDPDSAHEHSGPAPARQAFGGGAAGAPADNNARAPSPASSSGDEDEDAEAGAKRHMAAAAAASRSIASEARAGSALDKHGAAVAAGDADRRARIRDGAAKVGVAGGAGDGDVLAARPSTVIQVSQPRQAAEAETAAVPTDREQGGEGHPIGDAAQPDAASRPDGARSGAEADDVRSADAANRAAMLAAFAGDDVAAEFERDKEDAMQASAAAVEEPSALPGWGTWASSKREPRWLTEKKAKAEAERKRLVAARTDAKLKGVIVSEKWDKKYQKYTTPTLPFPYSQSETYEQSMRAPLGRDTNTEAVFREATRPAVLKQAGQIIQPLQLNSAALHAASHKRKKGESVTVIAGGHVKRSKRH